MLDSSQLASSAPTPIHRPPPTHSYETQVSIEEWIDRLRMSSPLTQDLATVNMLMTALNLTKDQATTAITEALNEGDDDKTTDVSRYKEVDNTFPDNFHKYLEAMVVPYPGGEVEWMAISDSFKAHMAGVTRHVEFKLNPARKHRLAHKASGRPKDPPTSTLRQNETFTLSNLNIFSVKPLIRPLPRQDFNQSPRAIGTGTSPSDPQINLIPEWAPDRPPSPSSGLQPRIKPYMTFTSRERNPSRSKARIANLHGIFTAPTRWLKSRRIALC